MPTTKLTVAVIGPAGSGKTALLQWISDTLLRERGIRTGASVAGLTSMLPDAPFEAIAVTVALPEANG